MTGFTIRRLELIELCLALRIEFSLRSFAVQIGPGAVVEGSAGIDPNLNSWIPLVLRGGGRFGQAELNQHSIKERQTYVRSGLLLSCGRRRWCAGSFDWMIRPQSPSDNAWSRPKHERKLP